jgi:hypothetical protein
MADTRAEVKGRAAALRLSQNLHNLVGLARCAGSAPFRGGKLLHTTYSGDECGTQAGGKTDAKGVCIWTLSVERMIRIQRCARSNVFAWRRSGFPGVGHGALRRPAPRSSGAYFSCTFTQTPATIHKLHAHASVR